MDKRTIYKRFYLWVTKHPDATVVVEDGRSVTYRELDAMSNTIMSKFYDRRYETVGIVAFLRRKDRQVMILGRRVEPEEVENVLNE